MDASTKKDPQQNAAAAIAYREALSLIADDDSGRGTDALNKAAVELLCQAVRLGHHDALERLGLMRDQLRRAAEQGLAVAQLGLGHLYATGRGVEAQSEQEAVRWWRAAAAQGLAAAQTRLGACYAEGRGVERDDAQAAAWLIEAANQSDDDAVDRVIQLYHEGRCRWPWMEACSM